LAELQRRVSWVRSFEITPAAEAGCNTYYLFFGTGSRMGLRRMKDAMWKVDPEARQAFRDSTLADHPVLFEHARSKNVDRGVGGPTPAGGRDSDARGGARGQRTAAERAVGLTDLGTDSARTTRPAISVPEGARRSTAC
jgi:hypothetical protein